MVAEMLVVLVLLVAGSVVQVVMVICTDGGVGTVVDKVGVGVGDASSVGDVAEGNECVTTK
jgi:hypothetical protein